MGNEATIFRLFNNWAGVVMSSPQYVLPFNEVFDGKIVQEGLPSHRIIHIFSPGLLK
jgi:hypothetical protein